MSLVVQVAAVVPSTPRPLAATVNESVDRASILTISWTDLAAFVKTP
jgi:hypothetical protein